MTQSAYGDKPGTAAHTGFVPGSGVKRHSAGGYFPITIFTVENHDTGECRKVVFDGPHNQELYHARYTLGDRQGCLNAGRRAENFARRTAGQEELYLQDQPVYSEHVI